jgi:CheY-like chemotaxis protein
VTAHELKLNVEMPDEPLYIEGDAARLQQVQVNLLGNAVKYTPAGGSIDFVVKRRDAQAVICIRDTGVGMSKSFQKRVFEPFVQADETLHRSEGGMGVGLTLVRSLIELHGGTVVARSDGVGKGSEFLVELPLSQKMPKGEQPLEDPPLECEETCQTRDLKLLIVEDNSDAREMMRMLLESYGFTVVTAPDGLAALTTIEIERPDIAFVDIGLPEMNGYDVARRVRRTGVAMDTHLVALTGYGQSSDRQKAQEAGFDDHLTKPVAMDQLEAILSKVGKQRADA